MGRKYCNSKMIKGKMTNYRSVPTWKDENGRKFRFENGKLLTNTVEDVWYCDYLSVKKLYCMHYISDNITLS